MVNRQKGAKQPRQTPFKLSLLASIFYSCSQGIVGWTLIQGLSVSASFAQEIEEEELAAR